jgi:hypothetical protein
VRSLSPVLALVALACAFAYPMQVNGWNQNAHYALVLSLARGTPRIDRALGELGDLSTGDTAIYRGHTYSAKAPGLALASFPAFAALRAAGMRTIGDTTRPVWALHVFTVALAGLVSALLLLLVGGRIERGFGTAAAATFGLATLALPFATLYFSHELAGALAFAAFAALWWRVDGRGPAWAPAAAGVAAGFAVTTEYPLAVVAGILGLYALAAPARLRSLALYACGGAVGLAPLLAYNAWAFGSTVHVAPSGRLGGNPHGRMPDAFGLSAPDPHALYDLLLSTNGLLTLTPVVACGVAGAALLFAGGRRATGAAALTVPLALLLVAASYFDPFGGLGPPRYLVAGLPFACLGLATAWRRLPLTTAGLAVVSALQMAAVTATGPLAAYDGRWAERLRAHDVVSTGAALVGVTGWYAILPFFAAVLVAAACAAAATARPAVTARDAAGATVATGLWALMALAGPNAHGVTLGLGYVTTVALAGAAAAGALAAAAAYGGRRSARPVLAG